MERRRTTNGRGGDMGTPRRTPRGSGEGALMRGHTPRKAEQRRSIADDAASDASDAFSDDDSSQYSAYTDRYMSLVSHGLLLKSRSHEEGQTLSARQDSRRALVKLHFFRHSMHAGDGLWH